MFEVQNLSNDPSPTSYRNNEETCMCGCLESLIDDSKAHIGSVAPSIGPRLHELDNYITFGSYLSIQLLCTVFKSWCHISAMLTLNGQQKQQLHNLDFEVHFLCFLHQLLHVIQKAF